MYFSYKRILSYNALLNMIIAERGVGKTYGATKLVINDFLKKGNEFVYIRRYKTDLQKGCKKFFEAVIQNEEFPEHSLVSKGREFYIDDQLAGYGFTLSTAHQLKGSNYSKVKYILFDEFLIENGQSRYLPNEVETFLGLIETIARLRDVRIIMLGNSTNSVNPYFLYFNLHLPYNNDIATFKDGLIALQYAKNDEYRAVKKETRFGKLVAGTDYEDYAINNEFSSDEKSFIEHKDKNSKFSFSIIYNGFKYGIWINWITGKLYVSNDCVDNGIVFACTREDHKPNTMLYSIAKKYNCWIVFIKNYKLGNVYFENTKIKVMCQEIMKNLLK